MNLNLFLGQGVDGRNVYWANAENAHISILGQSGTGKTYLISRLAKEACRQGCLLYTSKVRTLILAQRTKQHAGSPDISRAARFWSARTLTANTFTRTVSSTASILKPAGRCIWQTSKFRNCVFTMIKSVRN